MAIGMYLKEIGRGKDGARALSREQAADLMGQVLDGLVSDIELGAFCLAMRIKGETPQEMAGFLDATEQRMIPLPRPNSSNRSERPTIVIPTYNGARKLPGLTPLLALLLAQEGFAVLLHGTATENKRVLTRDVLTALDIASASPDTAPEPGQLRFLPTSMLCPGLQRLLDVRRVVQLRNSAHSVVKMMNPCAGPALIISSYTHPEYALSMAATFALTQSNAMLLRGTEGESVADPRRIPPMRGFIKGQSQSLEEAQSGSLNSLPDLPQSTDASTTATYIRKVLNHQLPVPVPIARQVQHIISLSQQLSPL